MYATRMAKPKLSLSIASATSNASHSLKSPAALSIPRSPLSPNPRSPTALNTSLNSRFNQAVSFSTIQQQQPPAFTYSNPTTSKSILKKPQSSNAAAVDKRIRFNNEPVIHCVTPIENPEEYYGKHMKMSREERRWSRSFS